MLSAPPILAVALGATNWTLVGGAFASMLTFLAAVYASSRTGKSSKEANAITFNKTLMDRLESLETDVDDLRRKYEETNTILSVSLSYIERLIYWGRSGGKPPEPSVPAKLRDRLDHLMGDH